MDPIERLAEFDKILRAVDLAVEPPAPAKRDYDFADRLSKDGQSACVSARTSFRAKQDFKPTLRSLAERLSSAGLPASPYSALGGGGCADWHGLEIRASGGGLAKARELLRRWRLEFAADAEPASSGAECPEAASSAAPSPRR